MLCLKAILLGATQVISVLAAVMGSRINGESTSTLESFKWIGEIVPGKGEVTLTGRDVLVSLKSEPNISRNLVVRADKISSTSWTRCSPSTPTTSATIDTIRPSGRWASFSREIHQFDQIPLSQDFQVDRSEMRPVSKWFPLHRYYSRECWGIVPD